MLEKLNEMDQLNVIEYMDGNEENKYYRFVNPFIRELFYQRMTFS